MTRRILSALALAAIATSGPVSTANAQSANPVADQIRTGLDFCERFVVDGNISALRATATDAGFTPASMSYMTWVHGDHEVWFSYSEAPVHTCTVRVNGLIPRDDLQAQALAWMQANRYQRMEPTVPTGLVAGRGTEQGTRIELELKGPMLNRHVFELRQAGS